MKLEKISFLKYILSFLYGSISFFNKEKYFPLGPNYVIILFKYNSYIMNCGLCSIISIKKKINYKKHEIQALFKTAKIIGSKDYTQVTNNTLCDFGEYLGGIKIIRKFFNEIQSLKKDSIFINIFFNEKNEIKKIASFLEKILKKDNSILENIKKENNYINTDKISLINKRLEILDDIVWCLNNEIINNLNKIRNLLPKLKTKHTMQNILIFKQINTVLNSINRLEVRGRDSAGLSISFILNFNNFKKFKNALKKRNLEKEFIERQFNDLLINKSINCSKKNIPHLTRNITLTYKIASEVGYLGDNTKFLRQEIKNDQILFLIASIKDVHHSISCHTRWASVGAITEPNCHPIDNITQKKGLFKSKKYTIHVCLNGEIDNYLDLKKECKSLGKKIQEEITTDTKIIPIKIEEYYENGFDIINSFRLAVNDFHGSHSIAMYTDLAPGKFLIAQKGSGQSMFIGIGENFYMPASEVYGFVEATNKFIRIEGDKVFCNKHGNQVQGQIFILDQLSKEKVENIKAMYYDGTPIKLDKTDIKSTSITSKDIDRKHFKHYFLKEIYESPESVEKTLKNKWDLNIKKKKKEYRLKLNDNNFPKNLNKYIKNGLIKFVYFIGQGTAGVAAQACAEILKYFLKNSNIYIDSFRSSEFSGFELNQQNIKENLDNTLVIAVTQSGTTTDTNRTIDMARKRKAHTMAIVNRRDSEITFKVDGVIYTSSGRDIEMSVASTKAFYSQIVAGVLLCLKISSLAGSPSKKNISKEIENLLNLPRLMKEVLRTEKLIKKSAEKLSGIRDNWAIVGSGPNKISADEIRIKLSELCYKTISSDFVEDKKHIDLSSEPLILVCAAGLDNKVLVDIIKDIAIFKAHKAIPIVIANKGDKRFEAYAESVLYVPKTTKYLSPILNTLVGHIWGYYAALSINNISRLLGNFRDNLQIKIDKYVLNGFDSFEIIRKKNFRIEIDNFYQKLRKTIRNPNSPKRISNSTDIILILKYLSGRLPAADFKIDFGRKGTSIEILYTFFKIINQLISNMSRPIDAIKHQAKTITVGTSRIDNSTYGILFAIIKKNNISISQISNKNISIIKNLEKITNKIIGSLLYPIIKSDSKKTLISKNKIKIINKFCKYKSILSKLKETQRLDDIKKIMITRYNTSVNKSKNNKKNYIIIPIKFKNSYKKNKHQYILILEIKFKNNISIQQKINKLEIKYNNIKKVTTKKRNIFERSIFKKAKN